MKYYIIAGERSGDMHAGNLIKELRKIDKKSEIKAVGGQFLEEAGATISHHYSDIAIMGFAEVLLNYRKVKRKFAVVKEDIKNFQPDLLILVDFGGFNLRIAKFAKQLGVKVHYYITPKVWAWNQKRAYKIKRLVDRMYVILPFEKEFYKKYDWNVDYVGNPVFDGVRDFISNSNFIQENNLSSDQKIVALLPGSRKQELKKVLPLYQGLTSKFPDVQFVVAGVKSLPEENYAALETNENLQVVYEQTYDLLSNADAAIVTSGTATLETALFKVPQIVVYKTSGITYLIARNLIKVKFISLVNLICNKEVVKEMIQGEMNIKDVSEELRQLLFSAKRREEILQDYENIVTILGEESASQNTARLISQYLEEQ